MQIKDKDQYVTGDLNLTQHNANLILYQVCEENVQECIKSSSFL